MKDAKLEGEHTDMFIKLVPRIGMLIQQFNYWLNHWHIFLISNDDRVYALKQIEGSGISMSACREIAVSDRLFMLVD